MHKDMGKRLGCIGWLVVKARKCRCGDDERSTAIDRLMYEVSLIWAARKGSGWWKKKGKSFDLCEPHSFSLCAGGANDVASRLGLAGKLAGRPLDFKIAAQQSTSAITFASPRP